MIGLKSPNEIIGKSDRDLFLSMPDEQLKIIEEIDQWVINHNQEKVIEEKGVNEEGELAFYITKKVPLKDDEGKIIGLIGTSINITTFLYSALLSYAY